MKDYLSIDDLAPNPFDQFNRWFNEVLKSNIAQKDAFILSTCYQNIPSSRTVLLKEITNDGFVFFTNYGSRKGQQISLNANVSMVFPWYELNRQVCVIGVAKKISKQRSDDYYQSRTRGSRIGTWASVQSTKLASRKILKNAVSEFEEKFADKIPTPDFWGGFEIKPTELQFWQDGKYRLHDRFRYFFEDNKWHIERLYP